MKRYWCIMVGISLLAACQNSLNKAENSQIVKEAFLENYKCLNATSQEMQKVSIMDFQHARLAELFKTARIQYKEMEAVFSFYYPEYAKKINGPAIDKNDTHDINRKVLSATGFQVLEEVLFNEKIDTAQVKEEIGVLSGFIAAIGNDLDFIKLNDTNIFEASRLEVLRVVSLGITGFDSPVLLYSLPEAKAALEGIQQNIRPYATSKNDLEVFEKAQKYLQDNQENFNGFDRANFITEYGKSMLEALDQIREDNKIATPSLIGATNPESMGFTGTETYNADFFAPFNNRKETDKQIKLGEALFFDPILSGNGKVSCASCHIPKEAYADHLKTAIPGEGAKARNTPTLLNAAYQNSIFLDGRVAFLEDQAKMVINNKDEMHGSFESALLRISQSKKYKVKFQNVFGEEAVTEKNLLNAIGSYVRSLAPLNSKFDQFLKGEEVLSKQEKEGFNIFMGKGKCATCHFFPLFNGSVPPLYQETESEVLGVPLHNDTLQAKVDEDLGEFNTYEAELKRFAFKTPTVRNSAKTWPYMHNGVYQTMEEVIDFYDRGGGAGIGIDLPNQTLPPDPLELTEEEKTALIAFIGTLNDQMPEEKGKLAEEY